MSCLSCRSAGWLIYCDICRVDMAVYWERYVGVAVETVVSKLRCLMSVQPPRTRKTLIPDMEFLHEFTLWGSCVASLSTPELCHSFCACSKNAYFCACTVWITCLWSRELQGFMTSCLVYHVGCSSKLQFFNCIHFRWQHIVVSVWPSFGAGNEIFDSKPFSSCLKPSSWGNVLFG